MTRLPVAVTSLSLAATLGLVALASTENLGSQGASSATPHLVGQQSAVPAPLPPSPSSARPSPAAPPTSAAPKTSTAAPEPKAAPESQSQSAPETHPQAVTKSINVEYQAQKTGYWCAPAATRIALSSKAKTLPDQGALAAQLGTTENGTDHIRQVVDGLNKQLAGTGAQYVTRDWGGRPLTSEMTQQLWSDTVRNVDDGKAMVANIVAPPGNQPPGYPSSQTIYHYVTIVGYNAADKTVQISDPARFSGKKDYWLSLDKVASLINPKGYAA